MLFGYRKTILNKKPGDISTIVVKYNPSWDSMYEGTLPGIRIDFFKTWGPYFFSCCSTQTYYVKVCVV